MSLADIYWFNEDTGQAQKPHARTHGDHNYQMNSTLCPAHLHIYHTLKCMVEEQEMAQEGFGKAVAKGTRFLRVPGLTGKTQKNRSTPESLMKYEPFLEWCNKMHNTQKGLL